jgi:hypothetical protein
MRLGIHLASMFVLPHWQRICFKLKYLIPHEAKRKSRLVLESSCKLISLPSFHVAARPHLSNSFFLLQTVQCVFLWITPSPDYRRMLYFIRSHVTVLNQIARTNDLPASYLSCFQFKIISGWIKRKAKKHTHITGGELQRLINAEFFFLYPVTFYTHSMTQSHTLLHSS